MRKVGIASPRRIVILLLILAVAAATQVRHPAPAWTRYASNPILAPSQPWERPAVQEPTVLREGGRWHMWYTGGAYPHQALGYATSRDGIRWDKYAGNPVLSGGPGGIAQNDVIHVGGVYYLYWAEGPTTGALRVATSPDGLHWTKRAAPAMARRIVSQWANSTVWGVPGALHMLVEGLIGGVWAIYQAQSADGLRWRLASTQPIASLQQAPGGAYGGPWLLREAGRYRLYYHAAPNAGDLPTALYTATSPDGVRWGRENDPLLRTTGGYEFDQVADPSVVRVGDARYLYYSGVNNGTSAAAIGLARDR